MGAWIFIGVFIGLPALLGGFIYPTQKRMIREAKRVAKFEAKYGLGDEDE
jgi:hypothetical protein